MQTEMKINYMILRDSIVINFDLKNFTVNRGSDEFENVLRIIKNSTLPSSNPEATSLQELIPIVDPQKAISDAIPNGFFVVQKGQIYSEGAPVSGYIGQKLLQFVEQGLPYMPLFNFWRKIKDNPSVNSRDQLYRFLESCKIPITEEGNFIAYKCVNKNLTDKHSGQFQYVLNQYATMPRECVVDSPDHACGAGLHVGSYAYATGSTMSYNKLTSTLLEVEVDPADVVSVPKDHSSQKLRAWRLLPVAVCESEYTSPVVFTRSEHIVDTPTPRAGSESNEGFYIGRDLYTECVIDADAFASISVPGNYAEVISLRPSKAPSEIKKRVDTYGTLKSALRFMSGAIKCYAASYEDEGTSVTTYIVFVPPGFTFVYEATPVASTTVEKYCQTITIGRQQFDSSRSSTFDCLGNATNLRSLKRAKFPVALRDLDDTNSIVRCVRGVDASGNSVFVIDIGIKDLFIKYSKI